MPKTKAPAQTFEEPLYLRSLVDSKARLRVVLRDDQEVVGTLEYWDADFIRLTRVDEPNLFIFKHDIKYFGEIKD